LDTLRFRATLWTASGAGQRTLFSYEDFSAHAYGPEPPLVCVSKILSLLAIFGTGC